MEKGDGPRYRNDCEQCVWLGRHSYFDLYFCPQGGMPTVIARFGPGPRYKSGLLRADVDAMLGEARDRAVTRGLLTA